MRVARKAMVILTCAFVLCLAGIVIVHYVNLDGFVAAAQARTEQGPVLDVTLIKSIQVPGLKDVVILGDQKTFILQTKDAVYVYRVDYVRK